MAWQLSSSSSFPSPEEARKQAYALAVTCQEQVEVAGQQKRVDHPAQEVAPEAWQRLGAGAGSKGPRLYSATTNVAWLLSLSYNCSTNATFVKCNDDKNKEKTA